MRRAIILAGGVVVIALSAYLSSHSYLILPIDSYEKGHIQINKGVLRDYYAAHGGEKLVAFTEREAYGFTQQQIHSTGHALGEVLYEHEGLGSIATCGTSFDWGCMHQTIAHAFDDFGPGAINALIERCLAYPPGRDRGNCEHGVGHGIAYADGYDQSKLDDAFKRCDQVTRARPIPVNDGCHAGLMMEFNMHFLTMEYEGQNGRPADIANPFGVCDALSTRDYKELCVWWVQPWLHGNVYAFEYTQHTFSNLGALCDQIADIPLRTMCYRGIGRSAGINGINSAQSVVSMCLAASAEPRMREACLVQGARTTAGSGNRPVGARVCEIARIEYGFSCPVGESGQAVS